MRHSLLRGFVLIVTLGLAGAAKAAAPVQAPVASYDSYKSWLVACDNTRHCTARGFSEDDAGYELTISRDAGPDGAARAVFAAQTPFDPQRVMLDGRPLGFGTAWTFTQNEEGTRLATSDLAAIRNLVQQVRNGEAIALLPDHALPLAGLTAALRRMDAQQGRTGTVTALLDTGPQPAASVPPAPPLPVIPPHPIGQSLSPTEAARLIAAARRGSKADFAKVGCDGQTGEMQPSAFALGEGRALVLLPCIMGAYQGSSLVYIADRASGAVAAFAPSLPYQGNQPASGPLLGLTEPSFEAATGTLAMVAKGRGLGDCGESARWVWNGANFRLSAFTLQEACGGFAPLEWPVLFRSRP